MNKIHPVAPSLETLLDLAEAHCRGELTPTMRELAAKAGVTKFAICGRLQTLVNRGHITGFGSANHRRGATRCIQLTDAGWEALIPFTASVPGWKFVVVKRGDG